MSVAKIVFGSPPLTPQEEQVLQVAFPDEDDRSVFRDKFLLPTMRIYDLQSAWAAAIHMSNHSQFPVGSPMAQELQKYLSASYDAGLTQ